MKNIAIFASGSGTNAQNIIEYFNKGNLARVTLVLCNNPDARVIERARKYSVPVFVFNRTVFYEQRDVLEKLKKKKSDLIVLAGFLWLVPDYLLKAYPGRIINIHPALLPGYGGKGMYGMKVHEAVIQSGDRETGITIHYVNEKYDEGEIIFQAKCKIEDHDTPESIAAKVHALEYEYYPKIIEQLL